MSYCHWSLRSIAACSAMQCSTCSGHCGQSRGVLSARTAVEFDIIACVRFEATENGGSCPTGHSSAHGLRGHSRLSDLNYKVIKSLLTRLPWQGQSVWGNVRNNKPIQVGRFGYRGEKRIVFIYSGYLFVSLFSVSSSSFLPRNLIHNETKMYDQAKIIIHKQFQPLVRYDVVIYIHTVWNYIKGLHEAKKEEIPVVATVLIAWVLLPLITP